MESLDRTLSLLDWYVTFIRSCHCIVPSSIPSALILVVPKSTAQPFKSSYQLGSLVITMAPSKTAQKAPGVARVASKTQPRLPQKKPLPAPKTALRTPILHSIKDYVKVGELGIGSDGQVDFYRHPSDGNMAAVKYPHNEWSAKAILREIKHFKLIGKHDHFVKMLTWTSSVDPFANPAIFLELCDLGNLSAYYRKWSQASTRIPEITIWKLLRDMSLALNHLHNNLGMVHGNINSDNIFVRTPQGHRGPGLPDEPIFKLADVARITPFPTSAGQMDSEWMGTFEFARPRDERDVEPVEPSVDMWSLEAVVQELVLKIYPIQSDEAFIKDRKRQGLTLPGSDDNLEKDDFWRSHIPVIHRPIDAPKQGYAAKYDVPKGKMPAENEPYSHLLNAVYSSLLEKDPLRRATSAFLVENMALIDKQIDGLRIVNQTEKELWKALASR